MGSDRRTCGTVSAGQSTMSRRAALLAICFLGLFLLSGCILQNVMRAAAALFALFCFSVRFLDCSPAVVRSEAAADDVEVAEEEHADPAKHAEPPVEADAEEEVEEAGEPELQASPEASVVFYFPEHEHRSKYLPLCQPHTLCRTHVLAVVLVCV